MCSSPKSCSVPRPSNSSALGPTFGLFCANSRCLLGLYLVSFRFLSPAQCQGRAIHQRWPQYLVSLFVLIVGLFCPTNSRSISIYLYTRIYRYTPTLSRFVEELRDAYGRLPTSSRHMYACSRYLFLSLFYLFFMNQNYYRSWSRLLLPPHLF